VDLSLLHVFLIQLKLASTAAKHGQQQQAVSCDGDSLGRLHMQLNLHEHTLNPQNAHHHPHPRVSICLRLYWC